MMLKYSGGGVIAAPAAPITGSAIKAAICSAPILLMVVCNSCAQGYPQFFMDLLKGQR